MFPPDGTYSAKRNAPIVITGGGDGEALMAVIPYKIVGHEGINFTGKHYLTIGTKSGELQAKNIAACRKCFTAWTTNDIYDLQEVPLQEDDTPEFELADCHEEEYTPPGKTEARRTFKASWFNPPGEGGGNMPEKASDDQKKAVITRWGSKLKATIASMGSGSSSAPASKSSAKPQQQELAPAAKKGVPGPKKSSGRKMTQEEVWDALCKKHPEAAKDGSKEQDHWAQDVLWPAAKEIAGNDSGELTDEQWGKVADKLGL